LERQSDGSWLLAFGSDDTATLERLIAAVKRLPASARKWDATEQAWWVRSRFWLHYLAQKVPEQGVHEALAAYQTSSTSTRIPTPQSVPTNVSAAFRALHLLSSAPPDVVKSAYRLAARRMHPDRRGGSHAAMVDLQARYQTALTWAEEHEDEV
jgi:hypothetical protein